MKTRMPVALIMCVLVSRLYCDEQSATFSVRSGPGWSFPVGESSEYFEPGFSMQAETVWEGILGIKRGLFAMEAGYAGIPLSAGPRLTLWNIGGRAGIAFRFLPAINAGFSTGGGYYQSILQDLGNFEAENSSGGNPYACGGFSLKWNIGRAFFIGTSVDYRNYFGLYQGIQAFLSGGFSFEPNRNTLGPTGLRPEPLIGSARGTEIIRAATFSPVFPVFHKYYDDHTFGSLEIFNDQDVPLRDIVVSFYLKQFMDSPKECARITELGPKASVSVEIAALFNDQILEITESTKANANISLSYTADNRMFTVERAETVRVLDRNAMTWEDDRGAAAFITARDPVVLSFAKNIISDTADKRNRSLPRALADAIAIHEALDLYGLSYIVDPRTPYSSYSIRRGDIDFLQFPRQTMEYKAGDCDDLAIVYSALLESVGHETALITVPGHIFMAVGLDVPPAEARKLFQRADDLIFFKDKTWLPVEITNRKTGFLSAWEAGARQWRQYSAREQAKIYLVHECWELFEPVWLPGGMENVRMPSTQEVIARFLQEQGKHIDREMMPQIAQIQSEIAKSNKPARLINSLGVLYARYGLLSNAEREFTRILSLETYVPALINLGNIAFLEDRIDQALSYYGRAVAVDRENFSAILGLARSNHRAENYGNVRRYYEELKAKAPQLAAQYAYLGLKGEEVAKAADYASLKENVQWED